jgi:hypothetical protein
MTIEGSFEVKLAPREGYASGADGIQLANMSIDKTFRGKLDANSIGEMLSAMTPVEGSAGYVAIEQVTGSLDGRKGAFVLQHYGIMDKGNSRLVLEVVPDSGSGELVGLSGRMTIENIEGQHRYRFEYEMP